MVAFRKFFDRALNGERVGTAQEHLDAQRCASSLDAAHDLDQVTHRTRPSVQRERK
jgi:hypothetical protein